jgi:hypothetical protein
MALLEHLTAFARSSQCTHVYVMGADATGDVPHVAAALLAKQTTGVVIFDCGTARAEDRRRALLGMGARDTRLCVVPASMLTAPFSLPKPSSAIIDALKKPFEGESKVDNKARRVATDAMWNRSAKATREHQQSGAPERERLRDLVSGYCEAAHLKLHMLHDSTAHAAEALADRELRSQLHVHLRGGYDLTEDDEALLTFWLTKRVPLAAHVVVLWGRTSGKDKSVGGEIGPHPYGDSSIAGLAQVAAACRKRGWTVVVVGDVKASAADRFPDCLFLGRFWNDPHWVAYAQANGATFSIREQRNQVRLFYLLKRSLEDGMQLVHVGMRSGNLDVYAVAGQDIIYLVAHGFDDRRIEALVNAPSRGDGSSRWTRAQPPEAPKRLFATSMHADAAKTFPLDDDALNVVKTSPLARLVSPASGFGQALSRLGELYPSDPVTHSRAGQLYLSIKAFAKQSTADGNANQTDEERALLDWFAVQRGKRGFTDTYIANSLIPQIHATLHRARRI